MDTRPQCGCTQPSVGAFVTSQRGRTARGQLSQALGLDHLCNAEHIAHARNSGLEVQLRALRQEGILPEEVQLKKCGSTFHLRARVSLLSWYGLRVYLSLHHRWRTHFVVVLGEEILAKALCDDRACLHDGCLVVVSNVFKRFLHKPSVAGAQPRGHCP